MIKRAVIAILLHCFALSAMALDSLPKKIRMKGVDYVLVPQGVFTYTVSQGGSNGAVLGDPIYRDVRVWLDAFYIAVFEAKAEDWRDFLNSTEYQNLEAQNLWAGKLPGSSSCVVEKEQAGIWRLTSAFSARENLPAAGLSWSMAKALANWMGARLPTEAEWQKAAKGDQGTRLWPWGDVFPDDTYGHFEFSGNPCHPQPVNFYPKGRSPYGVYNMAGNVAEWVEDWFNSDWDQGLKDGVRAPQLASSGTLRDGQTHPHKILKGGRWGAGPESLAIQARVDVDPRTYINAHDGVRFALSTDQAVFYLESGSAEVIESWD